MITKIADNLFQVKIPLPNSPLQSLNSYFLIGPERNLIIDTGMNRPECLQAMQQALQSLGLDLERTDLFITHLHADHLGLTGRLHRPGRRVYFNRPDAQRMAGDGRWEELFAFGLQNGVPSESLQAITKDHPGKKYEPTGRLDFTILDDGDQLAAGGYSFQCLATPGHTSGHLCLYEPQRRFLIAGDHILDDITPNIQLWNWQENPLARYLESLARVESLEVELVLPGHRRLIHDCRQRIAQLREHHRARLAEVLAILEDGEMDAFTVASRMTWDISPDWESFPVLQWWFATGEALSHLRYLEQEGRLRREKRQEKVVFARVA
ncbi:MAG: MBL fold metallo-hydrolase [Desulfarculus sp.]|jgi:glyoxylase-like metal-dependent hydrolase (beta-lactamase superfamily II)|nr:MAG: MBL fold metallo-hydrolase [Desulfarculus sp.]